MRYWYAILLLGLSFYLEAQGTYTMSGRIEDEATGQAIPFVSVLVKGTNVSTTSDAGGNFEMGGIQLSSATLVFYALGYEKKEMLCDAAQKNLVRMKPKSFSLGEVEVVSQKAEMYQENNNTEFLDFNFYDDLVIALVNKGGSSNYVQLIDQAGKLALERKAPAGCEKLVKDCLGNIHLLSSDSSYQVYYNYEKLVYMQPYAIEIYHRLLEPCVCSYGNGLYVKYSAYRRLKHSYYYADMRRPREKVLMASVADSSAIKGFNMDYDINYFLAQRRKGSYTTSVSEIKKNIDLLREQLVLPSDYSMLLAPASSSMFNIGPDIYLVDFTNHYISAYAGGDPKAVSKQSAAFLGDMSREVIIDDDRRSIYFKQEKNGVVSLFKYDPLSGPGLAMPVKPYLFPRSLKVKGGYVYFIYKNPTDSKGRKIVKYCCAP